MANLPISKAYQPKLLTRTQFREQVFARDLHGCVARVPDGTFFGPMVGTSRCPAPAADAHHILERRLWSDGGYYLENGASLCPAHHLEAESTVISCESLREWCGIRNIVVPEHLYSEADAPYDKWGNPILPNGSRMMGELFDDESVRRILAPVLYKFTNRVKYPRTYHLPNSPGVTADDRKIKDVSQFEDQDVVVTVKLDGENTTMYRNGMHARSLSYSPHPSRDRVKALHASIAHEIPETWRICGENLYAKHSIHYKNLRSYFQVFSIWDGLRCLSWDETVEWSNMLELKTVPVLYRGTKFESYDVTPDMLHDGDPMEGYVVRLAREFRYGEFRNCVAKYVRQGHVQTHGHWMRDQVVLNEWSSHD